jgi:hypothetical protein
VFLQGGSAPGECQAHSLRVDGVAGRIFLDRVRFVQAQVDACMGGIPVALILWPLVTASRLPLFPAEPRAAELECRCRRGRLDDYVEHVARFPLFRIVMSSIMRRNRSTNLPGHAALAASFNPPNESASRAFGIKPSPRQSYLWRCRSRSNHFHSLRLSRSRAA